MAGMPNPGAKIRSASVLVLFVDADACPVKQEVERVATRLGLAALLKNRPRQLSGGERQRVALARAIIRRPKAFLMDEPLSNLDARLRVDMRAELKHLQHELGIVTLYVTHDQAEAMTSDA